jgi:hypothetical protein
MPHDVLVVRTNVQAKIITIWRDLTFIAFLKDVRCLISIHDDLCGSFLNAIKAKYIISPLQVYVGLIR